MSSPDEESKPPQPPSSSGDHRQAAGDSQTPDRPPPFYFAPFEGGPAVFIPGARDNLAAQWDNAERRRVAAATRAAAAGDERLQKKKLKRQERARRQAEEARGADTSLSEGRSRVGFDRGVSRGWRGLGGHLPPFGSDQVPLLFDGAEYLAGVGGGGGDDGWGSSVRRRRRGKVVTWQDEVMKEAAAEGDDEGATGAAGAPGMPEDDEQRTARLLEARVRRQRQRRLAQIASAAAEAAAAVNAKACSAPPTAASLAAGVGAPLERMMVGVHLPTVVVKEKARAAAMAAMAVDAGAAPGREDGGGDDGGGAGDGAAPEQQGLSRTEIALLLQCMCRAEHTPDAVTSVPPGTARHRRRRHQHSDACTDTCSAVASHTDDENLPGAEGVAAAPSLFRRCTRALRRLWASARRVSDLSAGKLSDEEGDDPPLFADDLLYTPTADDLPLEGWAREGCEPSAYDADFELSAAEEDEEMMGEGGAMGMAEWVERQRLGARGDVGGGDDGRRGGSGRAQDPADAAAPPPHAGGADTAENDVDENNEEDADGDGGVGDTGGDGDCML